MCQLSIEYTEGQITFLTVGQSPNWEPHYYRYVFRGVPEPRSFHTHSVHL